MILSPLRTSLEKISDKAPQMRLLLVRHAQSANKERAVGQEAAKDPGLSELGQLQAEALGQKLARDLLPRRRRCGPSEGAGIIVVSSPMRRCILTIMPAVRELRLPRGSCYCHGACFEYGCAGLGFPGTAQKDIVNEFPDFEPIGFNAHGMWDYRGESEKETEPECRARATRLAAWLRGQGAALLQSRTPAHVETPTLILVIHQTLADALCHCMMQGDAEQWAYAAIQYKLSNAAITDFLVYSDGRATLESRNDNAHLFGVANFRKVAM